MIDVVVFIVIIGIVGYLIWKAKKNTPPTNPPSAGGGSGEGGDKVPNTTELT